MKKLNMCVFYKLFWAFAFVFAGFMSVSSAQEHTASNSGEKSSPLIIESKQVQALTERVTKDLEAVINCGSSQQFLTTSGCAFLNEAEPKTTEPFKSNMANCTGNKIPKWDGDKWYCATITVPKDCAGRVKLSECNTASISLANGESQTGVSCMGYRGTCDADVTCNEGSYVIDREYCPAIPVNCYDSVGGNGCTTMHSLNHGKSGTWTCDSGYSGECSAVCNNGSLQGNVNTCQSTGAWTAGKWSGWSACSATCGGGTQTRTRSVTCNYDSCTGSKPSSSQTQSCNTQACPTTGSWTAGKWSGWSACSKTCGGGTQTRTRSVTCNYDSCTGGKPASSQSQACNTKSCYSYSWNTGKWGSCSKSCGGGKQTRSVACERNDGKTVSSTYCSGKKPSTSKSCNTQACAPSCSWGAPYKYASTAEDAGPCMKSGSPVSGSCKKGTTKDHMKVTMCKGGWVKISYVDWYRQNCICN